MRKFNLLGICLLTLSLIIFFPVSAFAQLKPPCKCSYEAANTWNNNIPPRLEWNENFGYCGEVSLISAGLYYGQYASQYTVRAIASQNTPQYKAKSQLLLGVNDLYAAEQMHLSAIGWDTSDEKNTPQFLSWVKKNVLKGYPVAIGVYTNEYLFYGKTNPKAGDPDYDHIVPVIGIGSNHTLQHSDTYYRDDIIYFSDNGLWGKRKNPPFRFSYPFGIFQANRKQANAKNGSIYSLPNTARNYGIAIKGVLDINGDTLPVRVDTNLNYEIPEIENGSNTPPDPMPLLLTITVSNLEPGVLYNLYRYNDFDLVPNSNFNGLATHANQGWQFQIQSGTTYVMTENIQSNEIAVYRAVKATAP